MNNSAVCDRTVAESQQMSIDISELRLQDYDALTSLWQSLDQSDPMPFDSDVDLAQFLQHNSGLSVVARDGQRIIAVVLCRRDGNRGCVEELVMDPSQSNSDISSRLFDKALRKLKARGIHRLRVNLLDNSSAEAFWRSIGWSDRPAWLVAAT